MLEVEGSNADRLSACSVPQFVHFNGTQEQLIIAGHQKEHAQGPPVQARHLNSPVPAQTAPGDPVIAPLRSEQTQAAAAVSPCVAVLSCWRCRCCRPPPPGRLQLSRLLYTQPFLC